MKPIIDNKLSQTCRQGSSLFRLKKAGHVFFAFLLFFTYGCLIDSPIGTGNPAPPIENLAPPAAPDRLKLESSSSSNVKLSWNDNSGNERGFRIERVDEGAGTSSFEIVHTAAQDCKAFTDDSITPGSSYRYRICAFNDYGNSDYSEVLEVTTLPLFIASYYVDYSSGNDNNPGTSPDQPWKHAPGDPNATGNAKRTLQPGDAVLFKGGVSYRGTITINASGTQSSPIVYKGNGWGSSPAVIDGSEPLSGWTKCDSADACGGNKNWNSIYKTRVPAGTSALTSNLYQDDALLHVSQQPNQSDPFFMDDINNFITVTNLTQTTATDTWFNDLGGSKLIGSHVFIWRSGNEVDFRKITAFSSGTITFNPLDGAPYSTASRYRLAVANNIADTVLDIPGEYYIDETTSTVYLWPLNSKDPGTCAISISRQSVGFVVNRDNITIEGFIIQKGIVITSNDAALIAGSGCSGLVFKNNEISRWRSESIDNVTEIHPAGSALLENNTLSMNARLRGFNVSGDNIILRQNTMTRLGRTPILYMNGGNARIVDNYIYNCTGIHSNGISVYGGSYDITVQGNRVFKSNIPITLQDCVNIKIVNNIFHGDNANPSLAVWEGADIGNISILHNLLVGAGGWGTGFYSQISSIGGLVLKNNIMQGITYSSMSGDISHNIYTVSQSSLKTGELIETDLSKIFVSPHQADPRGNDYHLKSGSPAIDAGVDSGIYEDIAHGTRPAGNAVDIGAYEYN